MKVTDPHAASSRGTPVALVLLAAFGAGLTGGLVAHWMSSDPVDSRPATSLAADRDLARIAAEVHALTQSIEQLAQRASSDSASSSATPPGAEPLRPDSSTEALEAAIARLADTLGHSEGPHAAVAARASLTLPTDPQAALARLAAVRNEDLKTARGEHLFRSASDIIELYGLPDEVEVHDRTVALIYRSIEGRWQQSFSTLDGLVVNYYRSE